MSKDIIGISIGSKNTVIGTYKKGIFEVVLSLTAARELPTVVSYNDRERNIAELAMHTNKANYKRTFVYPNRWLGMQKNFPFLSQENKYSYIKSKEDKTGKVGFVINYKGKEEFYNPESLMGLFFSKIQDIWLKENIHTNEVVVSIPDYATAHERKAMLEAIELGRLKCTALLNESSAISLAYGFQKLKEFDEEKKRKVGFIDFGHSKTTIFFAEFTKKNVKVLSVSSERFCGAREFDYLIAQKLGEEFEKKFGSNPMEAPKCKIRLIDTITKVRKSLTVNKDVTISVDSLMDGEDLVYTLTREEFESLIKPTIEKFKKLCIESLKHLEEDAKVKLSDLHSIEMVGDTVRTPIILDTIKEVFKVDVSKTLVPDECIARGCALYAMMNSPYFHIQNFNFEHFNPYTVIMEYPYQTTDKKEVIKTQNIVTRGGNFPITRTITFTSTQIPNKENLCFRFFYDNKEINWLENPLLNSYTVKIPSKKEADWKFIVKFELDLNCVPKLKEAILKETKIEKIVEKKVEAKEENKDNKDDKTKQNNTENKPNEAKTENKEAKPKDGSKEQKSQKPEEKKEKDPQDSKNKNTKPEEANAKDNKKEGNEAGKAPEAKVEAKPVVKEVKTETDTQLDITIIEILYGTAKGILEQCFAREKTQTTDDKVYKEASSLKNYLEQYIYDTREKLGTNLQGYYLQEEKEKLEKLMETLMTWLYSEDEKLYDKNTLTNNSKDMTTLGNEIYNRFNQWGKMNENFDKFSKVFGDLIQEVTLEEEKMAKNQKIYLTKDDFVKIKNYLDESKKMFEEKKTTILKGAKVKLPAINPEEIEMLSKNLWDNVRRVFKEAEDKVKEEERKKKEEEEKKKKEEEEKKKKEEEEKKKKEEEEKKKKEEEEKKNKTGDKATDKSDKQDIEMKDASKENKENVKNDNKMEVE